MQTHTHKLFKTASLFFVIISLALVLNQVVSGSAFLQVTVDAPEVAEIETPIEIEVSFTNPKHVAGYELLFQFDKEHLELGGIYLGDGHEMPAGRETIMADEVPQGAAFAVYTCQIEGCVQTDEEGNPLRDGEISEELETVRLRLIPLKAGVVQVGLESARFVGKDGEPIELEIRSPIVEVKVVDGDVQSDELISNDDQPYELNPLPEQSREVDLLKSVPAKELDRNRDGVLSFVDVVETALVWKKLRHEGEVCALDSSSSEFDVNQDGCVDIIDIQLMALHPDSQAPQQPVGRAANAGLTFTVNSIADDADAIYGNGLCETAAGECTLRAAIMEANAQAGPNSIHFNIPGIGVQTIQLSGTLPTINDMTGGVIIDGFTQPGSSENTAELANNSVILIEVRGDRSFSTNFLITSPNNTLRGLATYDSVFKIDLYQANAANNRIVGNFIGTNASGTYSQTYGGGGALHIHQGANRNIIGTSALADRNVIGGAGYRAISVDHNNTDHNIIQNNIIGLNPSGTDKLPILLGIDIQWGPSHNIVGGLGFRERNVFSGSSGGVDLSHSQGTSNNFVVGNFMGTDLTGNQVFEYTLNNYAILIKDDAIENHIHHNVMAGSRSHGVWSKHNYNGRNFIYNNRIGVTANGEVFKSDGRGISLTGHNFEIGPGNIIAGFNLGGILIDNRLGSGPNEPADNSDENRIFQNSFYDNDGLAIDILPVGVNYNDENDVDEGPNGMLNYPVFTNVSASSVSGTACANCTVEVYIADRASGYYGGGRQYIGETVADSNGLFTMSVLGEVVSGHAVTALAIDPAGNTSEFAQNYLVTENGDGPAPVEPIPPNNLALGQVATQSTQYGNGVAALAVDGDTNGNYGGGSVTHTQAGSAAEPSWWEVDLGQVSYISTINVWNRTNCCPERTSNFHVFVSDVPFDGVTVESSQNQTGVSDFFNPGNAPAKTSIDVNRTGRYVRVQLSQTTFLSLAEVEVFGEPIENLAINKPTNQSSNWSSSSVSGLAVDGNTNGNFGGGSVTATLRETLEDPAWWEVDLGENSNIEHIHLWNRTDGWTFRLRNFYIFVSDVPFTGATLADTLNQPGVSNIYTAGEVGSDIVIPVNMSGQYVRIQLTDTENLSLAEAQVFGYVGGDNVDPFPTPAFPTATPIATGTPVPEIVPTQTPTPQPTADADVIVADSFDRTGSPGWGTADTGGTYTHLWGSAAVNDFSTDGATGNITLANGGSGREANLDGAIVLDSVSEFTFSSDQLPNANSFVRMQTRHLNSRTTYRSTLQVSSSGLVYAFVDRIDNGSWAKVGSTQNLGLQFQPNTEYRFKVQTAGANPTTLSLKVWPANGTEPTGWQHVVTDSTAGLQAAGGVGIRINLSGGVSNGPIRYSIDDFSVTSLASATNTGRLETVVSPVSGSWASVPLDQTYDSAVIACSIHYLNNSVPVVVRLRNVASDSFEMRLQNPGDLAPVVSDTVSCLVVEEGVWILPDDRKIEAGLFTSTRTDHAGNWVGQRVNYGQGYSNPVVFGQVMTSNDARWSAFWSRGNSVTNPANATNLYIGKEVGEDSDTGRLDETLGYIVMEAGSGTLESVPYEVAIGADTVYDYTNPTTYGFNGAFSASPTFGLVTQAAMDGGNGGWAQQFGAASLTSSGITVVIDEDQIVDSERLHTNEQVSYLVIEQPLSVSWGDEVVTPPTPETVPLEIYARDNFNRILYDSWGFGHLGGAYSHLWGADAHLAFDTNGSEGLVALDNNKNREAWLDAIRQQDFDVNFKFKTDKAVSSNQELFVSARIKDSGTLYRLRIRILPSGAVQITQIKAVNGSWSSVQSQTVPGLTHVAGEYLNVRYQVVGTSPTTLRAKVWADGAAEPADWHIATADSEAALETVGGIGFKMFNRNGSNETVTFSFDDLLVTNVTELPVTDNARAAEVEWTAIPSQGSTIYLPLTNQRFDPDADHGQGQSQQDNK